LLLKEFVVEMYANYPEILKAWKSSDNIIQHVLAQIVFEIVTDKIPLED
jgi:hypothetical protein